MSVVRNLNELFVIAPEELYERPNIMSKNMFCKIVQTHEIIKKYMFIHNEQGPKAWVHRMAA